MQENKIAIIGLGYVGLPLAAAFAEKYPVIGFDIHQTRIDELRQAHDRTLELSTEQLRNAIDHGMQFTTKLDEIAECNIYIVTVPTPIDKHKKPDLTPLYKASESIGKVLKKDDIVIYESTVYPGCTEEECVPVLEKFSGLKFNVDFFCGYSPERINPGDKEHTVTKIKKVTSGSTPEIGIRVNDLYASIITAGTHLAPTIKVAEAAKVIENSQRDINIALMNELSVIFHRLGLDMQDVLAAAGTKWNFLPFTPGLVGGHCIGVDPYYLTHRAEQVGYHPEVILSGRRINDAMGPFVATAVIEALMKAGVARPTVVVLGVTFKENVPDFRNTRVVDIIAELERFGVRVAVHDPLADPGRVEKEYGLVLTKLDDLPPADAVILATAHDTYRQGGWTLVSGLLKGGAGFVADVRAVLNRESKPDGIDLWRL